MTPKWCPRWIGCVRADHPPGTQAIRLGALFWRLAAPWGMRRHLAALHLVEVRDER